MFQLDRCKLVAVCVLWTEWIQNAGDNYLPTPSACVMSETTGSVILYLGSALKWFDMLELLTVRGGQVWLKFS
jgi:hypothetical protein